MPEWLAFDPETGAFTGTPGNDDVEDFSVRITATDAAGHEDVESFKLVVEDTNDAPTVEGALEARTVAEGEGFSLTVPADLFADADAIHGDTLTLDVPEVQSLNWASFHPTTGVLSGSAPASRARPASPSPCGRAIAPARRSRLASTWSCSR